MIIVQSLFGVFGSVCYSVITNLEPLSMRYKLFDNGLDVCKCRGMRVTSVWTICFRREMCNDSLESLIIWVQVNDSGFQPVVIW